MVVAVFVALSSRLQPREHCLHYSHGGRESIHSGEFLLITSDESLHCARSGGSAIWTAHAPVEPTGIDMREFMRFLEIANRCHQPAGSRSATARRSHTPRAHGQRSPMPRCPSLWHRTNCGCGRTRSSSSWRHHLDPEGHRALRATSIRNVCVSSIRTKQGFAPKRENLQGVRNDHRSEYREGGQNRAATSLVQYAAAPLSAATRSDPQGLGQCCSGCGSSAERRMERPQLNGLA
jgi:hypothetical protein